MPTVLVDGRQIHYLTGPSGLARQRRSIVFVHGAGGNALVWQRQRYGLDRGVNTVCLDLPGHGASGGSGCDRVEDYSHWLLRFIDHLGLERVIAAGHSLGGAVVLEAALQRPGCLEALMLIGSGARLRVSSALLQGLELDFAGTARELVQRCYGPESSEEQVNLGLESLLAEQEVVIGDLVACDRFDRLERTAEVKEPVLLVCGGEDELTPPKYSRHLAARLPRATLTIIQGAGHMVMLEKPEKLNIAVIKFLAWL